MALFDRLFGGVKRRRVAPTQTAGVTGANVIGGFLQDKEDNAKLRGRRRYRTFSEMLANTSIVAAGTRYFLNLVSKADWKLEPAKGGEEVADRIEFMIGDMERPFYKVVRRGSLSRMYGFSVQEWTAKRNKDGSIGFLDIAPRPQITIEQWDVDENGKVVGVVQRSPVGQKMIYIPRSKLVYVVDDTLDDSPEGLGLFRHIVETTRQLTRFEQLEGYGFETDLRGVPVGRAPFQILDEMVANSEMSADQRTAILLPMRDFIEKHIKSPALGLLIDSITYTTDDEKAAPSNTRQWDLELLKSGNTSQDAIARAIQRKNREIARVLGVENLLLGESGAGSLAMARDKSDSFALIVDSTQAELVAQFDKDVIEPLMMLNGWPDELKPTFKPEKIQHRDISEVTGALRDMAAAGAILAPDDPVIDEVRDLLGLSKQDIDALAIDAALNETSVGLVDVDLPGGRSDGVGESR